MINKILSSSVLPLICVLEFFLVLYIVCYRAWKLVVVPPIFAIKRELSTCFGETHLYYVPLSLKLVLKSTGELRPL